LLVMGTRWGSGKWKEMGKEGEIFMHMICLDS